MFSVPSIQRNGISVNLISNNEDKSIIHFASNQTSSLSSFMRRLKPVVNYVIDILRNQQPQNIALHVTPSLSFGNTSIESRYVVSLTNFDFEDVLNEILFSTNNIDGGYFELQITDPRYFVDERFRFLSDYQYYDVSSDSNYDTDESD